jgi:hypothetical protein
VLSGEYQLIIMFFLSHNRRAILFSETFFSAACEEATRVCILQRVSQLSAEVDGLREKSGGFLGPVLILRGCAGRGHADLPNVGRILKPPKLDMGW